jgi:hypothetical protein
MVCKKTILKITYSSAHFSPTESFGQSSLPTASLWENPPFSLQAPEGILWENAFGIKGTIRLQLAGKIIVQLLNKVCYKITQKDIFYFNIVLRPNRLDHPPFRSDKSKLLSPL